MRRAFAIFVLALVLAGGARAATPRLCEVVGFSPDFSEDRTAFCVADTGDSLLVSRSTDGGATWNHVAGTGLQGLGAAFASQVIVSPEYAADHTVYVHVVYGANPGLYRSTDDGDTFVNVAPLAGPGYWSRALTPFLLPQEVVPEPVGSGREAFAYASPYAGQPALVAPPLHQPVVGSPDPADLFLLPPGFPETDGFAIARGSVRSQGDPTLAEVRYSVYRCDAALTCAAKVADLPVGWNLVNGGALEDGSIYVALAQASDPRLLSVWRSTEAGVEEWTSLDALLPDLSKAQAFNPSVSVVSDGTRYFARVSYDLDDFEAGPPTEQLFASKDAGRSWRRVAWGRGPHHAGRKGTIPWSRRAGPMHARGDVYVPAPGVLVVVARTDSFTGLYCSWSGGRTWSEGCAR